MSAPKFTPGPWQVEMRPDSGGGDRPVVVAGAELIAAVSRNNGIANADLISAAPEMYAALEDLVQRREREANKRGGSASLLDGSDGRYARARATLAKARGER